MSKPLEKYIKDLEKDNELLRKKLEEEQERTDTFNAQIVLMRKECYREGWRNLLEELKNNKEGVVNKAMSHITASCRNLDWRTAEQIETGLVSLRDEIMNRLEKMANE